MIDPADQRAAELIGLIAYASAIRRSDGKLFWGGLLSRRMRRCRSMPLRDVVARLLRDLQVPAYSGREIVEALEALTADEEREVAEAIVTRADLIAALAMPVSQSQREESPS